MAAAYTDDEIDVITATFGKACGSVGAFIAGKASLIQQCIQGCRSFIYTTALPDPVVAWNLQCLTRLQQLEETRQVLQANAHAFRGWLVKEGVSVKGSTQIVPVIMGSSERAVTSAQYLKQQGIWVLPIHHPTVAKGQERLRFSLTPHHTLPDLERVAHHVGVAYHMPSRA